MQQRCKFEGRFTSVLNREHRSQRVLGQSNTVDESKFVWPGGLRFIIKGVAVEAEVKLDIVISGDRRAGRLGFGAAEELPAV